MIPVSGQVLGQAEIDLMVEVCKSGWITAGKFNQEFERALGDYIGVRHVFTVNSGSSANLLAVATLVEAGVWKAGDHVHVPACSFPTTVNPLLMFGLVPTFIDSAIGSYNASCAVLEHSGDRLPLPYARSIAAHTLGNPLTWTPTIEDCCDALGARYPDGNHVGTKGLIGTCSFFPAHHITMGEGGAVWTHDPKLARIIESLRSWGRDCWCEPGCENSCNMRFDHKLPDGTTYDHKYLFTYAGFNLKITDIQAACGLAQLDSLDEFVARRRANFAYLLDKLEGCQQHIHLPDFAPGASPFGFPITFKEKGLRNLAQTYLKQEGIDSRLLFAGNITRQPYMKSRKFEVAGPLDGANRIHDDTLWVGCHPALSDDNLESIARAIRTFVGDF